MKAQQFRCAQSAKWSCLAKRSCSFSFPWRYRGAATFLLAGIFAMSEGALAQQTVARPPGTKTQPVTTQHAMVVSVHHEATDVGVAILKQGGNAVDAAVATGFALAVVNPIAGNLGGGGFMLIRLAKNGDGHFLDFREKAPMAATRDMYVDEHGNVIEDSNTVGYKSIGVPGSVAGFAEAEKRFGKLKLAQVMAPAIRLAREGFSLSEEEADELHDDGLARFPESRRVFQRDGNYYKTGETFRQPDLARTLERIAANPDDFYHGALAKEFAAALAKHGALITAEDLAAYQVKDRAPLYGNYHGYDILTAPPPSAGGVILLETLNMLATVPLAKFGDRTPEEMHWIVEAYRRAYKDRNDYLGDPDFVHAPLEQLLSKAYGNAQRATIDPNHATPSAELKRPSGFLPAPIAQISIPKEASDTTHYSILDEQGNAVAVTYTLNGAFGSHATADGLGFLLNNEMDDFTSKVGALNSYGFVGSSTNAIAPGKRPLSSMTPTMVVKDGKVRMVLGAEGGSRIPTTVTNILLSVLEGGLNIQEAVDAPRFHHQYLHDVLYFEPAIPAATVTRMKAMGYIIDGSEKETWSDGECLAIDGATGTIEGGQDHRHSFGKAAGY